VRRPLGLGEALAIWGLSSTSFLTSGRDALGEELL